MAEQEILNAMEKMCEESLSPEMFDKWEEVKNQLIENRKDLL
jgi:hypothetical protein